LSRVVHTLNGFINWSFSRILSCFTLKGCFWRKLSFVCPSPVSLHSPYVLWF
jgi:hypothetical protein